MITFIQFLMDFIVLVILFGNGVEYFYALVTVGYLIIPLWSYLVAKYTNKE